MPKSRAVIDLDESWDDVKSRLAEINADTDTDPLDAYFAQAGAAEMSESE